MAVNNAKPEHDTQFDKLIGQYIALRTKLDAVKAAQKKHIAPLEEMKETIAAMLTAKLDQNGQTSAKTIEGTVYITEPPYASLSDADAFMSFITETGLFELMDRKANAPACLEYAKEHGALPPGVKINIKRSVGVRKA